MVSLRSVSKTLFGSPSLQIIKKGTPDVILNLDAVVSEDYSRNSNVSRYPVESSSDISEHAMIQTFRLQVQGIISDSSMNSLNVVENVASSSLGRLFGSSTKSQTGYDLLEEWQRTGQPLFVRSIYFRDGIKDPVTNEETPFVIESLTIPRNKDVGASLRFSMSMRQIKQVKIGQALVIAGLEDRGQQALKANEKANSVGGQSGTQNNFQKLEQRTDLQQSAFGVQFQF